MHIMRMLTLASICLVAGAVNAAPAWYDCTVVKVGVSTDGVMFIQLTDAKQGAFTNKWFVGNTGTTREMLAVALTATTNGRLVQLNADLAQGSFPTVNNLYMMPASP